MSYIWTQEQREKQRQRMLGNKINKDRTPHPNSLKNLRNDYWATASKKDVIVMKKRVSEWSKAFYSDETKHPNWTGNRVKYGPVHRWVDKWKGQPETCENCGKTGLKGHKIHWANIDHSYKRVLEDYIRLCTKCHGQYDKENNLRKRKN